MPKKQTQSQSLQPIELSASQLRLVCDPNHLGFQTTNDLPDLQSVIGQPRALRALDLGSEVTGPGFNIFVLGQPGSGRTTLSREYLERKAMEEQPPDDWCYINNFDDPRQPIAVSLPAGQGSRFREQIDQFIQFCLREIPAAFKSKEYIQERERLIDELNKQQETEFLKLQHYAEKYNFIVARTPVGIVLVPSIEGKPLKPEDVSQLSEEQKQKLENLQKKLSKDVEKTIQHVRELTHQTSEQLTQLNQATVLYHIGAEFQTLTQVYTSHPQVNQHLDDLKKDILKHLDLFQDNEENEQGAASGSTTSLQQRYAVNLLVDNSRLKGAPVIVETHPVYHNLLGRIEHEVVMGAARTDFTKIRPGAFHRANGGYLILPARDLLNSPYAWEGVKRVLRDGSLRIIEIGSLLGLMSTETLEPEPIPLNIKIILVGAPMIYYLLQLYDEDFSKFFKVRAEFGALMDRTPESEHDYGLFVKSVVEDNQLPPFDRTAIARMIEYSARLADDQQKLSTRFGRIADLVRESAYWARKNGDLPEKKLVTSKSVERAIEESTFRHNLLDEHLQELISQGTFMVDLDGMATGQINALSVIAMGDYAFGRPNRVTATVAPGRTGLVDIERQAELGGPIHTKGVLILSGYLQGAYAHLGPLSLSASLTFEQSYGEIEGDSASAAELLTLLSAIAQIPMRQDLAITGSVNQHGQIQAIGGVNEKIEGFFASCKATGLTGKQGVIIPQTNVRNLMLRQSVIQAVEAGQFHIYPIQRIEQGIELLSGLKSGQPDKQGNYPSGSFNHALVARLENFIQAMQKFSESQNTD